MPQRTGERLAREWRLAGMVESAGRFIGNVFRAGRNSPPAV